MPNLFSKIFFLTLIVVSLTCCGKSHNSSADIDEDFPDVDNPAIVNTDFSVSLIEVPFNSDKDACLIVVKTKKSWTATTNDNWLNLSARSGDGNTGFLIGATPNRGFPRKGKVTIKSDTKSQDIILKQKGASSLEIRVNDVYISLILVEDGTFILGDSYLAHQVELSDYYIAETETTRELWNSIMGDLSAKEMSEPFIPAYNISWNKIKNDFLPAINQKTGKNFRLPTEAEWEYAAKGGKHSNEYQYSGSNIVDDVSWLRHNADLVKEVKLKLPNELGLYDMSGNVPEWCNDWYSNEYGLPVVNGILTIPDLTKNPAGSSNGTEKVVRGGGIDSYEWGCRVTSRNYAAPSDKYLTGFRLALSE